MPVVNLAEIRQRVDSQCSKPHCDALPPIPKLRVAGSRPVSRSNFAISGSKLEDSASTPERVSYDPNDRSMTTLIGAVAQSRACSRPVPCTYTFAVKAALW